MTGHLVWRGGKASMAVGDEGHKAVEKAAEKILAKANKRVPFEYGDLERSSGIRSYRKVTYVFYDKPYAVRLHEHPEYNFQHGRRGKWLETTLREHARDFVRWVGEPWKAGWYRLSSLFR